MASLVKNGDTYGLIWTDSSRTPKQVGESLKTKSHKRAKQLKAYLENQYFTIEDGRRSHDPWKRKWYHDPPSREEIVLGNTIEKFIRYKSKAKGTEGWRDTAQRNEAWTMRKFARFIGENRTIASITDQDLEDFYYRDKINSDHTRKSLYISVNTFLNWCIDEGYLSDKPTFKPKKPQAKVPKFITVPELGNLLGSQPLPWVRYGWMILAGTGMRPVELSQLKLQHIEDHAIIIGEDFTTKTRAERRVPLLFEAPHAIRQLRAQEFTREHAPQYLLGRSPSYARQTLSRKFSESWENEFPDKPKRTLYNLKDMFAVRFLSDDSIGSSSGLKLNELKEILGHASLETTQKYLKAIPYGTAVRGSALDYIDG